MKSQFFKTEAKVTKKKLTSDQRKAAARLSTLISEETRKIWFLDYIRGRLNGEATFATIVVSRAFVFLYVDPRTLQEPEVQKGIAKRIDEALNSLQFDGFLEMYVNRGGNHVYRVTAKGIARCYEVMKADGLSGANDI